jgi:3-deoxy-D-arabino-heptulosonate 7-phosphate (DAHP) synthase
MPLSTSGFLNFKGKYIMKEIMLPNQIVPVSPTTDQLERQYPLLFDGERCVAIGRMSMQDAYALPEVYSAHGIGECGVVDDNEQEGACDIRSEEADKLQQASAEMKTLIMQRLNVWKPRTKPEDWHGVETTNPDYAYAQVAGAANKGVNVCMEVGYQAQLERYKPLLTMAWIGARTLDDPAKREDMLQLFTQHHDIPLGVKNGQDGEIDDALTFIDEVNDARQQKCDEQGLDDPMPAFLIYRGGNNYLTPELVEEQIIEAIQVTNGKVMIDTAHGVEIAYDPFERPDGKKQKSIEGQELATQMIAELAQKYAFMGILSEASSIIGVTDPNMPIMRALRTVHEIQKSKSKERV